MSKDRARFALQAYMFIEEQYSNNDKKKDTQ